MLIREFSIWTLFLVCVLCCLRTVYSNQNVFRQAQNNTLEEQESMYYSIDGSKNNPDNPSWGQRKAPRVRYLPQASRYFDQIAPNTGGGIPVDETNFNLPSARRIMEDLFSQATPEVDKGTNHLMLEFGHFIVQDIIGRTLMNATEPFPMPCDGEVTDVVFCPVTGKSYSIPFDRSQHATFANTNVPRASLNGETAFMDMSNMYGNTLKVQTEVREFQGGRVKLDEMGLPPILDKYNSSPGVFAIYCVFLRYHNILAEEFEKANPTLTDEELFQMARHKTIAIYQSIAEEKYIPTLLGFTLEPYVGYNASVDPSIDEFFAAASFRYAHSSFSGLVRLLDENFDPTGSDPLILRDVFRQPSPNNVPRVVRKHGGIEPFLRGLTVTNAKAVDASLVHDLNYFTEATSLLDIQRGRDMGLPSYNDAREAFNLSRVESFEALVGYDYQEVLVAVKELYSDDIEKLDAYVGALLEAKSVGAEMGPLFSQSIKNQFERLRDGDRLWYRNRYTQDEWEQFPSLAELIRATCQKMDNLPAESFLAWDGVVGQDAATCGASATQLSLINGKFSLGWQIDVPTAADLRDQPDMKSTIEVSMIFNERMNNPGFLGVGWRSQEMKGAEIWFCTANADVFATETFPEVCDANSNKVNLEKKLFSCCIADGGLHVQPVCSSPDAAVYYELTIVDWCLTPGTSRLVVTAPVCDDNAQFDNGKVNCFRTTSKANGDMDFIVAYNPNRIGNHGYQMRTAAAVDLSAGVMTQVESETADVGLIATHAIFMLFGWMVLAPMAIFIVRYMKTKEWRLVAHVSLMGITGSMMVPLLIGVEASVGATDKTQEHSFVGLSLLGVYFIMVFAGRVRYHKLQGKKVGRKTYFVSKIMHKYGGVVFLLLAWWNCYTGLVRIGPEDSYFQILLLSTYSMGYNLDIFGFIQQYIYFPYLGVVCLIFIVAEARLYRLNSSSHVSKLQGILEGTNTIWEDDADKFLEKMTMDSFMEATKLGTMLCIVDGYVLDITSFVENHPGGQHLLRYAAGSDITEEFVGKRDVDGMRHVHSHSAVQLMKTFVKAVLVDNNDQKLSFTKGASSRQALSNSVNGNGFRRMSLMETIARVPKTRRGASVFRRGRVVGLRYLTPDIEITHTAKPVILLQVALPKTRNDLHVQKLISLPSCAFTFRGIDKYNAAVDRQYTPVKINNDFVSRNKDDDTDEEVFDFVISLVPGGKMTKIFLDMRVGKVLLAQGPTVNQETVTTFRTGGWSSVVMIAAGTGVSPMLQVIDYYIGKLSAEFKGLESTMDTEVPNLYLMWIVKGPKYNYAETLALDSRVERSNGKFKYMVIYSTSHGKKEAIEKPRHLLHHQWTFKELLDKTKPKAAGLFGFKKPQKVKRSVVDAAWKSKATKQWKSKSTKQSVGKAASAWISKSGKSATIIKDDQQTDRTSEFSIQNGISPATWTGDKVQTCYRSYNKMLLEELLRSIPKTGAAGQTLWKSDRSAMPSIIEGPGEDADSDDKDISSNDQDDRSSFDADSSCGQNSSYDEGSRSSNGDNSPSTDSFKDEDSVSQGSRSDSSFSSSGPRSGLDIIPYPLEDIPEGSMETSLGTGESPFSQDYVSLTEKEETGSPDSVSLAEKEETGTVSTERSGSSPEFNPQADLESSLLTSWAPPKQRDRSSWMPPTGLDAAKNASYESDYVSFDHKQLKKGFSTTPSGTLILRNPTLKPKQTHPIPPRLGGPPPEPKPSHPIPPRLGSPPPERNPSRPISPPVPKSISAPSNEMSSSPPKASKNPAKVQFARNIPLSQNKPARSSKPARVSSPDNTPHSPKNSVVENQERPSLDDRTASKMLKTTHADPLTLSGSENSVEAMLNQLEINEEEFRDRKILVAISGAPMFEYKTRVNLSDLGFPKENMVTFHASAQQL